VTIALLHAKSREKLIQRLKKIWERLRESKPASVSISQGAVRHLAEAAKTSRTTREAIKSRLRVHGKLTALSREIRKLFGAKFTTFGDLSAELERKTRAEGKASCRSAYSL